jgi:hypothetical protein
MPHPRIAISPALAFASLLALAAALPAIAGCGGSEPDGGETASVPGGADPAQVEVIDRWSKELASGDVAAAAEFFAIPSVAQNGLVYEIADRQDARRFNASLPCGAELVEARPQGELTIATFELIERPGPGKCGEGTGNEATTAFRIVDGKIAEWQRVFAEGEEVPEAPTAPSSSA